MAPLSAFELFGFANVADWVQVVVLRKTVTLPATHLQILSQMSFIPQEGIKMRDIKITNLTDNARGLTCFVDVTNVNHVLPDHTITGIALTTTPPDMRILAFQNFDLPVEITEINETKTFEFDVVAIDTR